LTRIQTQPAVHFSNAEFRDAVLKVRPGVAVFDCDGTIWSADAGYGFMVWSLERGLVSRNASDWIDSRYRLYLKGDVTELEMCGEMVQVYAGLRESEIRKAAALYFHTEIEAHIFPEMRALIGELSDAGSELWAVSSTNHWVIEEAVRELGIPAERILSARVKVANGVITSELLDVPTGEGKAWSLVRAGVLTPDAVFGNSIHDIPMLEIGRFSFPVNPTPALAEVAALKQWPVFHPESLVRPLI
jgi:phosphoserine phosphatase